VGPKSCCNCSLEIAKSPYARENVLIAVSIKQNTMRFKWNIEKKNALFFMAAFFKKIKIFLIIKLMFLGNYFVPYLSFNFLKNCPEN